MNKYKHLNIIIPIVAALIVFTVFLIVDNVMNPKENKTVMDLFDGTTVQLIIGAEIIPMNYPPIVRDNEIALDIDTVRMYFDDKITWDESNKKVIVTTADRLIRMNTGRLQAFVNDKEVTLNLPAFEESGAVYVPIKFLSDYYNIDVSYNDDNKVVMIDDKTTVVQIAKVIQDGAVVRNGRSIKEPIVKKFEYLGYNADEDAIDTSKQEFMLDDEMYVYEHYDNWYKVRTKDGIVGYIEKKFVVVTMHVDKIALQQGRKKAWKPENGKINMVWDLIGVSNPNTRDIPDMPGLDVISPTWFDLIDKGGGVSSRASTEYLDWAHNRGYKVWALFRNDASNIEMTSAFLNDSEARENAIRSILAYVAIMDIDGINLDFEYIYLKDKDALTQFVSEMAPMLREQGVTFSVDVNVPDGSDNWSKCYDTPAIAAVADYVAVMTYDQTAGSSSVAGSVAEHSWVENNIAKLVERDGVPPQKLILGLPLYVRLWEMERNSPPEGRVLSTKAIYMGAAINLAFENQADISWESESGQFFCSYQANNKTYRMWLEDTNSINLKSSLIHKYNLAGVSSWSREFAISEVWDVLNRNTKSISSYIQWQNEAFDPEPKLKQLT